ncbi:MAG: OsmC family protein [Candidatus Omnitrophica bacterium]|nr:OsmC family protein [Candidatus Omnitrophota bacterium]
MSEHKIVLEWKRESENFDYDTYNRNHAVAFDNGLKIKASAAPDYKGHPGCVDPEEMLVAAVSSCHMLTFLAIASKRKIVIDQYDDNAVGFLEKNSDEKMAVTRIELHPQIVYGQDKKPTKEEEGALHQQAHQHCFIANSVSARVQIIL